MTIPSNEPVGTRRSRSIQKDFRPSSPSSFDQDEEDLKNESAPLGEVASSAGRKHLDQLEEDENTAAEKLTLSGLDSAETERREQAEIGRQDNTRL